MGGSLKKFFGTSSVLLHFGHHHDHDHDHDHDHNDPWEQLMDKMGDSTTVPSPRDETLKRLMQLLVSEEEAEMLSKFPKRNTKVKHLAKKFDVTMGEMNTIVDNFAQRGILFDYYTEKGDRYAIFHDLVIGFFEFICMRDRNNELPMNELDRLFSAYCETNGMREYIYQDKECQLMRTYVREDQLSNEQLTKILDYESVLKTVGNAHLIAVQDCTCKTCFMNSDDPKKQELKEKKKKIPGYVQTCFSFNGVAESLIRNGIANEVTAEECLAIVDQCKDLGMVQTADNSKDCVFLCNCEKETCKFIGGFGALTPPKEPFQTSNFIASYNPEGCVKCTICVQKCPVDCYSFNKEDNIIEMDPTYCLGCGVCSAFCKGNEAIVMEEREKRVYVPEDYISRMISTSYNRGDLTNLLFQDPDKVNQKMLRAIFNVVESSKAHQKFKSFDPLRSVFIKTATKIGRTFIQLPWNNSNPPEKYKKRKEE